MQGEYIDGYIERKKDGRYEGSLSIEGIRLPSITAVYFEDEGKKYLWIKRKKILVYEFESQTYKEREAKPYFEAYLEKQVDNGVVAYKGEFNFMRFKYSIVGVWDNILGKEKQRLNLFVERLPMSKQTIINKINEFNRKNDRRRD
jgi:hypothetical protein